MRTVCEERKADGRSQLAWRPADGASSTALRRPIDAIEWLARVFGFVEETRMSGPNGELYIAVVRAPGGGTVMIAGPMGGDHEALIRSRIPQYRDAAAGWPNTSYSITVMVPDVDAHYDRALAEGAQILTPPHDRPWGYATTRPSTSKDGGGTSVNASRTLIPRIGARVESSSGGLQVAYCAGVEVAFEPSVRGPWRWQGRGVNDLVRRLSCAARSRP